MANAVICDGCGESTTDPDDLTLWIELGFHDGDPYDACSPKCAKQLVDSEIHPIIQRVLAEQDEAERAEAEAEQAAAPVSAQLAADTAGGGAESR